LSALPWLLLATTLVLLVGLLTALVLLVGLLTALVLLVGLDAAALLLARLARLLTGILAGILTWIVRIGHTHLLEGFVPAR
jgi:hypothetical protein